MSLTRYRIHFYRTIKCTVDLSAKDLEEAEERWQANDYSWEDMNYDITDYDDQDFDFAEELEEEFEREQ